MYTLELMACSSFPSYTFYGGLFARDIHPVRLLRPTHRYRYWLYLGSIAGHSFASSVHLDVLELSVVARYDLRLT